MASATSASKNHPAWVDKLFPIVFCIAGLALIGFGSKVVFYGYSSKGWPTIEGTVTESRMARTGSGRKGFRPVVDYSYTVDRNGFSSDRILFGMASFRTISKSSERRAYEWLDKYPEGKRVPVAYNPSDPGNSTLNTGVHYTAWIAPLMGVLFLAAGLALARTKKKKTKQDD